MTDAPLYLSDAMMADLEIATSDVVTRIENLLRGQAENRVWSAPKSALMAPDGRYMMSTLAVADDPPLLAVKSLVLNPDNPAHGLPQINGMITLLDSRTGLPAALLDGNWITGLRTAALSAVGAKRLARPESQIAAFIGCGVQAHSHLKAFTELYPLREIRAFGRGQANRDALCCAAEELGHTAVASATAKEAVEGADIIVTSVTFSPSLQPFLDARWLKPGVFAAITDMAAPWDQDGMGAFDRIVIDDREQESQAPKPMAPANLVAGELVELITQPGMARQDSAERTAFMFRGMSIGDLALAGLAYERARSAGVGTPIGA